MWQDKAWANRFRLWCGKGAMILANLGMVVVAFVAIFFLLLGFLDLKHQQFRQGQILERLGGISLESIKLYCMLHYIYDICMYIYIYIYIYIYYICNIYNIYIYVILLNTCRNGMIMSCSKARIQLPQLTSHSRPGHRGVAWRRKGYRF